MLVSICVLSGNLNALVKLGNLGLSRDTSHISIHLIKFIEMKTLCRIVCKYCLMHIEVSFCLRVQLCLLWRLHVKLCEQSPHVLINFYLLCHLSCLLHLVRCMDRIVLGRTLHGVGWNMLFTCDFHLSLFVHQFWKFALSIRPSEQTTDIF